jgi:hypothetical protein
MPAVSFQRKARDWFFPELLVFLSLFLNQFPATQDMGFPGVANRAASTTHVAMLHWLYF